MTDARWAKSLDISDQQEGYIKHEATALEKEMTYAVKQHLIDMYPEYTLVTPVSFPKVFNSPVKSGEVITELDGAYLSTNDPEVKGDNKEINLTIPVSQELRHILGQRAKQIKDIFKTLTPVPQVAKTILVIVEAKHLMTEEKIKKKLEQVRLIEQYIEWSKNPPPGVLQKFLKTVDLYNFKEYESKVKLYLGGVCWEDDAFKYIQEILKDDDIRKNIGVLQPNGTRFGVYDVSNAFRKTEVPITSTQGGRKRTSKKKI